MQDISTEGNKKAAIKGVIAANPKATQEGEYAMLLEGLFKSLFIFSLFSYATFGLQNINQYEATL